MASPTRKSLGDALLLSPRHATAKENLPQHNKTPRSTKPSHDDVLKDRSTDSNARPSSSGQKRKLVDADPSPTAAKKLKADPAGSSSDERRCHQCARKLAMSGLLRCTRIRRGGQCGLHYCKACMKNRYGEDANAIREAGIKAKPGSDERELHVDDASGYLFSCPRCQNDCNCRSCRKSSGLPATGALASGEGQSARDVLKTNPLAKSPSKSAKEDAPKEKPAPKEKAPKDKSSVKEKARKDKPAANEKVPKDKSSAKEKLPKDKTAPKKTSKDKGDEKVTAKKTTKKSINDESSSKASTSKTVTKKASAVKVKPAVQIPSLPAPPKIPRVPEWQEVSTDLTRQQVEDRLFLREFMVRFGPVMQIAKMHLEALDDFEYINDAAVKAIVVALLDVMNVEAEGKERKYITLALKDARASNNSARLWNVLEQLRSEGVFDCPDPTEPDPNRPATRNADHVAQGMQLLPALVALCEHVIRSNTVRSEIEERSREHPQYNRDALYGPLKEVNDAWTEQKKTLRETEPKENEDATAWKAEYKKAKAKHDESVTNIEQSHYESDASFSPRFQPVGRDLDGRVYYILSSRQVKKLPSESDMDECRRWAWFVAVWGTPLKKEADDDGAERWMAISDSAEIKHTAKWLNALALHDEYNTKMEQLTGKGKGKKRAPSPDPLRMASPLSSLSSSSANSSTSSLTSLSDDEDVEMQDRDDLSDLSSLTSDEDDDPMDVLGASERKRAKDAEKAAKIAKRVELQMARYYALKPTVAEVKAMGKELHAFADFLQWRLVKDGR